MGNILSFKSRYEAETIDEIRDKLSEFGICYVPNVLTDEERLEMISGTWDFFEHLTKNDEEDQIVRQDPRSWSNIQSLCPTNDMLFHHWNAGHSQHSWNIRQNPKICQIFADFWKCNITDLLTSFDGFSFLLAPEITGEGWYTHNSEWYHLDQSLERPYFDGIQAFVTAYDIREGDATLSFYEKSHNYIMDFIDECGIRLKGDWYKFTPEEVNFFDKRCLEQQMKCPAKSLVMWDSRLVHCGLKPKKSRNMENTKCISYISYSTKDRISNIKLAEKKQALENMITSNHYAHNPNFFNTLPTNHINISDYVVPINAPKLTNLGKSLAGYCIALKLIEDEVTEKEEEYL